MNNQNNLLKNNKLVKNLRGITNFLFWGTSVFTGVLVALNIFLLFTSEDKLTNFLNSSQGTFGFTLGSMIRIRLTNDVLSYIEVKPIVSATLLMGFLGGIAAAIILRLLCLILNNVKNNKPFHANNGKYVNIMGITIIVASIVIQIFAYRAIHNMVTITQLDNLDVYFQLNITGLLMGLLLIILGEIFKYGSFLQNEYDETL